MRAIARRRKVLVAELPGPSGNAASVRAGRRPPGPTFVRSSYSRHRHRYSDSAGRRRRDVGTTQEVSPIVVLVGVPLPGW
ncbi:hypothetical protein CP978_33620 [Streptomyces nodosus]|uniref:Uncharacterized protein n=1 Tax=Streptomyces nodosus TaxID=40318 RepID=A0A5P2WEP5_9ACTN|nr:hypothetical protein CP978_33620 [Streptomyces nodosus]